MRTLLVIDDEPNVRRGIRAAFRSSYEVIEAGGGDEAVAAARDIPPDVALLDLKLGTEDGLDVLAALRAADPAIPVVVLTAYGSIERCVQAMKAGAVDFIQKPFDIDELGLVLERSIRVGRLEAEVARLRGIADSPFSTAAIVGESPRIQAVRDLIHRLAPHATPVLVTGPSGTGKELVARALHGESPRRDAPFVVVNCAAIPEGLLESDLFGHERGAFTGATARRRGKFEVAEGGTIFLDEVGDMPAPLRPKLLRVLEDGTFQRVGGEELLRSTARVVSATNRDLASSVREGTYREDLYYRLNGFTIDLPPLQERKEDIPLLVAHFAARESARQGRPFTVPPEVLQEMEGYDWPGNVRELAHAIARLAVLAGDSEAVARVEDLPPAIALRRRIDQTAGGTPASGDGGGAAEPTDLPTLVERYEARVIREALDREKGHRLRTASALGISIRTLQYKLARYGIA